MSENLDVMEIVKQIVVLLIISLVISAFMFLLTKGTASTHFIDGYDAGISWISFIVGVLLTACIIGISKEDMIHAGIFGLIIGLLTGLLESPVIYALVGDNWGEFFTYYIGNQTFLLIIVGIIFAIGANLFLKDKVPHYEFLNRFK